jgi:hypothetical protein
MITKTVEELTTAKKKWDLFKKNRRIQLQAVIKYIEVGNSNKDTTFLSN